MIHILKEEEILKKQILSLCAMVEGTVAKALNSIDNLDTDLAQQIIDNDREINKLEVDIEEECLKILALHQPVASDLRYIVGIIKINNDLERIADLAVNISERCSLIKKHWTPGYVIDLSQMSDTVFVMLKKAIDSFIHLDLLSAKEVCKDDEKVDELNRKIYDEIKNSIKTDSRKIQPLIHYLAIARNLERIGDHATNIAEDIIYMVEGVIIRHFK